MNDKNKEYLDKILRQFHSLIDFYRMEYDEELLPLFLDFGYLLIGRLCRERRQDVAAKRDYLKMTEEEIEEWICKFREGIRAETRTSDLYRRIFAYQLFVGKPSILRQILQTLEMFLDVCDKIEDEEFFYEAIREIYELCIYHKRNSERYVLPDFYVKIFAGILDLEKSPDRNGENLSVLDTQAGAGTVLIAAGKYWPKAMLYGYEEDRQMQMGAEILSILSGKRIHLTDRKFLPEGTEKVYDIVFANPPFTKEKCSSAIQSQMPLPIQTVYGLSLVQSMLAVRKEGMAVLIVPDSFLFSTKVEFVNIRKWMYKKYSIEAVISLPPNTFHFNSSVKSSVLIVKNSSSQPEFFMREEEWKKEHPYLFFYDLEAESNGNLVDIWNQRDYLFNEWRDQTENFLENYNLIRTPGNWKLQELWFADEETLTASGWNLLPAYYKPAKGQVLEFEDAEEVLKELIQKQEELLSDMKELLLEVCDL
ncbi:MAG: N-6 DNA methylase [Blautia sp.]